MSDGSHAISYSYDSDGNPYQLTDGTGTTTTVYDAANDLVSDAIPGGPTLTYGYDPAGNLVSAAGDGQIGLTAYHYNKVDEVDQMTEPNGHIDIFAYNADHDRTDTWDDTTSAVTYSGNTVVAPAIFAVHIHDTYNTADELTEVKTTRASSEATTVADLAYSHTVPTSTSCTGATSGVITGMRQTSTDQVAGQTTSYCYNQDGELTQAATTGGGPTYSYGYDGDGNRTSDAVGSHSFNSADQLTDTGTTFDANGNLTASAADPAVAYNSINQTTTANGTNLAYAGATQNDSVTVGATTQTNGLLGVQVDSTDGAATYYEHDPQATLVSEITAGGEYYYAFDGQGALIALIDTQRAAYTYDPYGSTATALNGTLPTNPWRYDSGYLDPSGLYHLGARYYDPTTGRFTQPDPTADATSGNLYAYAGDNPVNNGDPTGTMLCDCLSPAPITANLVPDAILPASTPISFDSPAASHGSSVGRKIVTGILTSCAVGAAESFGTGVVISAVGGPELGAGAVALGCAGSAFFNVLENSHIFTRLEAFNATTAQAAYDGANLVSHVVTFFGW